MSLSKVQKNYDKLINKKNGRSKWFGFVETRAKVDCEYNSMPKLKRSKRGNPFMLNCGLKILNKGF